MNGRHFNLIQVAELRQLVEEVGDDPILGPQFRARLEDAEREVRETSEREPAQNRQLMPHAAIYLRSGGVQGTDGIRPSLAGEALIRYEKMFTEQALYFERENAKTAGLSRRRRGTPRPELWFTGTPRGSFGLEFVPHDTDDLALRDVRARALVEVTEAINRVANITLDEDDQILGAIPPTVLQPMKQFMKTLAQYGAELRLGVQGKITQVINSEQISRAADRLEREMLQDEIAVSGTFRGLTLLTGHFDFVLESGEVISGTVAEELEEDELNRMHNLTNLAVRATFLRTVVRTFSGYEKKEYTLLRLEPLGATHATSMVTVI